MGWSYSQSTMPRAKKFLQRARSVPGRPLGRVASSVKRLIQAYSGCPSALSETAATNGTLFSEPRPALPPGSSPPR